jgi:magnesium transporter
MSESTSEARPLPALEPPPFRDADDYVTEEYVQLVTGAVLAADAEALKRLTDDLHEVDMADLLEALEPEDRPRLVSLLGRDFDYAALTELDDTVRDEILEEISNEDIAQGVAELETDDAVAIIEDLDPEDRSEVIAALPAPERVAVQRNLDYPEGSIGRLMHGDVVAVPPFWTVGQTIDHCREAAELPERFFELYVVDPAHKLVGSVPLDKLLRTKRPVPITELVEDPDHAIHVTDEAAEVAPIFQDYNLIAAPVLDENDRLVGVVTVDDMVDVIGEEAEADIRALGGVSSTEELSAKTLPTARGRFPWLFANSITAVMSASVIGLFSDSLEKMVALAVLMPIVASLGGNAGTQTMTVVVRALATRELGRGNAWRIARREAAVGLLNGLGLALFVGLMSALWFQNPNIGVVIGLALTVVVTIAALTGLAVPLTLDRLGVDPAVSSGPFVTTTTDVVGFFTFLGLATLWFRL